MPRIPDLTPAGWEDDYGEPSPEAPVPLEFFETDNPCIAWLYGPDGEVILEVYERRTIPFGYRKD